jgi:hypothetical protein
MASIWYWVTQSGVSLGYLTAQQLRERHGALFEASLAGEAERSSAVVRSATVETAADRGRAREAQRATVLPFRRGE